MQASFTNSIRSLGLIFALASAGALLSNRYVVGAAMAVLATGFVAASFFLPDIRPTRPRRQESLKKRPRFWAGVFLASGAGFGALSAGVMGGRVLVGTLFGLIVGVSAAASLLRKYARGHDRP